MGLETSDLEVALGTRPVLQTIERACKRTIRIERVRLVERLPGCKDKYVCSHEWTESARSNCCRTNNGDNSKVKGSYKTKDCPRLIHLLVGGSADSTTTP